MTRDKHGERIFYDPDGDAAYVCGEKEESAWCAHSHTRVQVTNKARNRVFQIQKNVITQRLPSS